MMATETFEFQGTSIDVDMDYRMGDDHYEFTAQRRNGKPAPESVTIRFSPEQRRCIDDVVELFGAAALPVEMGHLLQQEEARLNAALYTEIMSRRDPDY